MPSIILVSCLWQSSMHIITLQFPCLAVGAHTCTSYSKWGLTKTLQSGIRTSALVLDTTFLMIYDDICFAFTIIPLICSSQQMLSQAETTTPRSLSFSTTYKGVLPIIKLHLGLSLPI